MKGTLKAAAKLLQSTMAIGAVGKKGTFMKVTRLIDRDPKYMADMGEGEDKTTVFIADPTDANQQALLEAAEANKTVVFSSTSQMGARRKWSWCYPDGRSRPLTSLMVKSCRTRYTASRTAA